MEQLAGVDKVWDAFLTWQFMTAAMFVVAIMTGVKKTIIAYNADLLKNHNVVALLTAGNMLLGFVVALPKGFLAGDTYFQRMFTGMVAGFASHFLYHALLKRFKMFGANESTNKDDEPEKIKAAG